MIPLLVTKQEKQTLLKQREKTKSFHAPSPQTASTRSLFAVIENSICMPVSL